MSAKKEKTENTDDGLSKKRYPKDDKEQSQRFVETAKDLETEEDNGAFEEAMESIKSNKD